MVKLTEEDVRQIAKDASKKKTPHSVLGISITAHKLTRDASSGKFVPVARSEKSR